MSDEEELVNEAGDIIPPDQPGPQRSDDSSKAVETQPTEPYDFDHCTIQIGIQLLPDDGHAEGRPVIIGVRDHRDAPLIAMTRWVAVCDLPDIIKDLLTKLADSMPARKLAYEEAEAKRKAADEAEKAKIAELKKKSAAHAAQRRANLDKQKKPATPPKPQQIVPDFGLFDVMQPPDQPPATEDAAPATDPENA